MKNCAKCGASLEDNALFCNICGAQLTDSPVQTANQPAAVPQAVMQGDTAVLPAKKKSNHLLFIVLLVVLAIVACVMLWWFLYGQYRTYDALRDANDYAKMAYEAADETARNAYIDYGELLDPLDYTGPVSDIPESNAIGKAVKSALEEADVGGYICIRFHSYDNNDFDTSLDNFVQWSAKESGAVIGQCPWAPNSEDKSLELEFGTYSPGY